MNSRQLLEIANRAIATGGIAPPSEVLEIANFTKYALRYAFLFMPIEEHDTRKTYKDDNID